MPKLRVFFLLLFIVLKSDEYSDAETRSRLLVVSATGTYPVDSREIFLYNKSTEDYPYIGGKSLHVSAIEWVSKLRSIVVAVKTTQEIRSYRIDSSEYTTLRKGVDANAIAVDEGRQLIFLAITNNKAKVYSLDIKGKRFKEVQSSKNGQFSKLSAISLDTAHRTIYACDHSNIISTSYDGNGYRRFKYVLGVVIGPERQLFYSSRDTIMRVNLSSKAATSMGRIPFDPYSLHYYANDIYISPMYREYITVLNILTGEQENRYLYDRKQTLILTTIT